MLGSRRHAGCWIGGILLLFAAPLHARTAKNIILCIGDGMSTQQVAAARLFTGTNLFFETFPYQRLITTRSANADVTDSAAGATALATGHKVNNGVISLALPGDGGELETILEYFQKKGKRAGLVTTATVTHATPAAFGAHEPDRNRMAEIAADYLERSRPYVLFGGGGQGMSVTSAVAAGYVTVTNAAELLALANRRQARVSGQFGTTYLPFEHDGVGELPHLSQMVDQALNILDDDRHGFFLMIEGGRIDHACHANDIARAVREVVEFDRAVQTVVAWAGRRRDTLVLVTADHETGGLSVTADNGPGREPTVTWGSAGHTAAHVPVYGWGFRAHVVTNMTDNTNVWSVLTGAWR